MPCAEPPIRPRPRTAFTLLEMLLVVVIVAMTAAFAFPSIRRMLDAETLRQAAEQVRARWGAARLEAMKTGRIHVFVYQPGAEKYRLDVWYAGDDALEASDAMLDPSASLGGQSTSSSGAAGSTPPLSSAAVGEEERLPEGLIFLSSTTVDARAEVLEAQATSQTGPASGASGGWSSPIFFYPDGTTSTAELTIIDKNERVARLDLRGLTGIARIGDGGSSQ